MIDWIATELNCHQVLNKNPWMDYSLQEWEDSLEEYRRTHESDFNNPSEAITIRGESYMKLQLAPKMDRIIHDTDLLNRDRRDAEVIVRSISQRLLRDCVTTQDGVHHVFSNACYAIIDRLGWDALEPENLLSCIDGVEKPPVRPSTADIENVTKIMSYLGMDTPMELLNSLLRNEVLSVGQAPLSEENDLATFTNALDKCLEKLGMIDSRILKTNDLYTAALRSIKSIIRTDKIDLLSDYFQAVKSMKPLMDRLICESGNNLGSSYINDLLDKGLSHSVNRELVLDLIACECYRQRIPIDLTSDDVDTVRCRECGSLITGRGLTECPICDNSLCNICPCCGNRSRLESEECPVCRFQFQHRDTILESDRRMIEGWIHEGKIVSARSSMSILKANFPHYKELSVLEQRLNDVESHAKSFLDEANGLYIKGLYYSAMEKYIRFQSDFPELFEDDLDIRSRLDECSKRSKCSMDLVRESTRYMGEHELNLMKQASEYCPDHPEVLKRMIHYAPMPPSGVTVTPTCDGVVLRMKSSDDTISSYSIIRVNSITGEAVQLNEFANDTFVDRDAPPGVPCRYRVYSRRGCILSESYTMSMDTMAIAEIEDASYKCDDLGIRLEYTMPGNCTGIIIDRRSNDDSESTRFITNGDRFHDTCVRDGTGYTYVIKSVFNLYGEEIITPGITLCATSMSFPQRVNELKVSRHPNGDYVARWECDDPVELFLDLTPDRTPMGIVESHWFKELLIPIEPTRIYKNGMRFALNVDGPVSIVPVSYKGGFGCEGVRVDILKLEPCRKVKAHVQDDVCLLTMEWPHRAKRIHVKVTSDDTTKTYSVSYGNYMSENGVYIPLTTSGDHYFMITAVYDYHGDRESSATEIHLYTGELSILSYSVDKEGDCSILTIRVPPDKDVIPALVATTGVNGIPLSSDEGSVIWQSHYTLKPDEGVLQLRLEDVNFDTNTRLFFKDEDEYSRMAIVHPLRRRDNP